MKSNCSNEMQYQENKIKNTVLVLFSPVSYFRELKDGDIELGVHIADVTHFVKPNSWTDLEARARFVQIYVSLVTVYMLVNCYVFCCTS